MAQGWAQRQEERRQARPEAGRSPGPAPEVSIQREAPSPRPGRRAMELPRARLLAVSHELDEAELAALKFLSRDHVPWGRLEAVRSPHDLFEALQEKGVLEAGNPAFLRELLYYIGRMDLLVSHLGSSREQVQRELQAPGGARLPRLRWVRAPGWAGPGSCCPGQHSSQHQAEGFGFRRSWDLDPPSKAERWGNMCWGNSRQEEQETRSNNALPFFL